MHTASEAVSNSHKAVLTRYIIKFDTPPKAIIHHASHFLCSEGKYSFSCFQWFLQLSYCLQTWSWQVYCCQDTSYTSSQPPYSSYWMSIQAFIHRPTCSYCTNQDWQGFQCCSGQRLYQFHHF